MVLTFDNMDDHDLSTYIANHIMSAYQRRQRRCCISNSFHKFIHIYIICNCYIIASSAIRKIKHKAKMANIAQGEAECYISIEAECFILRIACGRGII